VQGIECKYEIIEVEGRRRGKGIEIFLETPLIIGAKPYWILSFKGSGAEADGRAMVIHPVLYYYGHGKWTLGDFWQGRTWGVIEKADAETEFHNILKVLGWPCAPHIALNDFPSDVVSNIAKVESTHYKREDGQEPSELKLSQIVRVFSTNIRTDEAGQLSSDEAKLHLPKPAKIAKMDAIAIKSIFRLKNIGTSISSSFNVAENRFIDGLFTDSENYELQREVNFNFGDNRELARQIILSFSSFFNWRKEKCEYAQALRQATGIKIPDIDSWGGIADAVCVALGNLYKKTSQSAGASRRA
jgi:hypothetical protein